MEEPNIVNTASTTDNEIRNNCYREIIRNVQDAYVEAHIMNELLSNHINLIFAELNETRKERDNLAQQLNDAIAENENLDEAIDYLKSTHSDVKEDIKVLENLLDILSDAVRKGALTMNYEGTSHDEEVAFRYLKEGTYYGSRSLLPKETEEAEVL